VLFHEVISHILSEHCNHSWLAVTEGGISIQYLEHRVKPPGSSVAGRSRLLLAHRAPRRYG